MLDEIYDDDFKYPDDHGYTHLDPSVVDSSATITHENTIENNATTHPLSRNPE